MHTSLMSGDSLDEDGVSLLLEWPRPWRLLLSGALAEEDERR